MGGGFFFISENLRSRTGARGGVSICHNQWIQVYPLQNHLRSTQGALV